MEAIRVLHLECRQKNADIIASMLSSCTDYCFEIKAVSHIRYALEELNKKEKYDIVLSGLMVADAGGPDIAQKLLVIQRPVPLIFLVEEDSIQLGKEMVSYGAQDYLPINSMSLELLRRSIFYAIERQKLMQQIQDLSLRDDLTRLYNRRGFRQFAEQQLRITNRSHQPVSLIFVDMDNLKVINDTFGHHTGDIAIKELANVLTGVLRASDIVGRLGGDEFIILTPDTDTSGLKRVLNRINTQLKVLRKRDEVAYQLNASVGAIVYDGKDEVFTLDQLQHQACKEMYKEKHPKQMARKKILDEALENTIKEYLDE